MKQRTRELIWLLILLALPASAQIDPIKRQLIQVGYNLPIQGHSPFSGYAFYYRNDPDFIRTNITWRLALAPVYLDTEIGFRHLLGENTDLGIGIAGGGFADTYSEIRQGTFHPSESFVGHSAEAGISIYHLFNPQQEIPLNLVLRGVVHRSFYEEDDETAPTFAIPEDRTAFNVRTGLRWGGQEPLLFPALAMELSAWYEGSFRTEGGPYGFNGDRKVEFNSHQFWGQAMLAYTFPKLGHNIRVGLSGGTTVNPDRFSAYRLGALLPMVSEFPLNLPGYYYQEISAERFGLASASYLMPLDEKKHWNINTQATVARVEYLSGLEQPGRWHYGVSAGVLYRSPADALKILLAYSYGVNAIRGNDTGAHSISLLIQVDLEQSRASVFNPINLDRWRGWQRLFGS